MKILQLITIGLLILASCKKVVDVKGDLNETDDSNVRDLDGILIQSMYLDNELLAGHDLEFEKVKTLTFDLDKDNKIDSIILYRFKDWNDPGDFHKIQIKVTNGKTIETIFQDAWVRFNNNYKLPDKVINQNKIDSDYLLIDDLGRKENLVFLFGYVYSSDPAGTLTIYEVSKSDIKLIAFNNLQLKHTYNNSDSLALLNNGLNDMLLIKQRGKYRLVTR
jgi:hypothetical protein